MKTFDIFNAVLTPIAYIVTILLGFIIIIATKDLILIPIIEWFNN